MNYFPKTFQLLEEYKGFEKYSVYRNVLLQFAPQHPNLVVDACKSALEGFAKTYLLENGEELLEKDFQKLMRQACQQSKYIQSLEGKQKDGVEKILSGIVTCCLGIATIRNTHTVLGHGSHPSSPELDDVVVQLLIEISDTWASFILLSLGKSINSKKDTYEENIEFNDWFDANNAPVMVGESEFYASEALYKLDEVAYMAYLAEYNVEFGKQPVAGY